MKTEKLIQSLFTNGSSSRTNGIIALIAGLAAGAVLGVLFAPESGASARQKLRDAAGKLMGSSVEEQEEESETPVHHNSGVKRPKSDIKNLVHEAHVQAASFEHGRGE